MPDEPTLREIMYRLDAVARQMSDLAAQMREDRQQAAATYVRQDVYARDRQLVDAHVADIRHDIGQHQADIAANRAAWRDLDAKINDRFRQVTLMVTGSLLLPIVAGTVLWLLTTSGGI